MIVLKVLNIESCGAYKQMPNFSGGVSEVCTDISQAIKKEREMPENRGSYANNRGIGRAGLSVCEGVKRNRAGDEAGLGSSGYIMHSLMGYSQVVLFYCVVNGENSGEIGWQTLPLVFSRIAKALEGLERWASRNDIQHQTVHLVPRGWW